MKKIILFILLMGIVFESFGQGNDKEFEFSKNKLYVTYHLSIGGILVPKMGSLAASFNFQIQKGKFWGLGLDLTKASYRATSLNKNPSFSEVSNYDPEFDPPLPSLSINGDNQDDFIGFSFYYLRNFRINDRLQLHLSGGPSLIFLKKRHFDYSYSPGFPGTFSGGGSPPSFTANSTDSTESFFGGYFRIAAQYRLSHKFAFEFSPFVNFNGTQTIVGVQLGVALGTSY